MIEKAERGNTITVNNYFKDDDKEQRKQNLNEATKRIILIKLNDGLK